MDDVMDYVESASERIALYELRDMTPEARELAAVLVRATQTLVTAVGGSATSRRPRSSSMPASR
jgi:uncharacterized protein Yka (UPF0111/DUF47 family)